jgi:hypothetical protein
MPGRFSQADFANGTPMFNVPDAAYDRQKAATALAVYKDIRKVPTQLQARVKVNRTDDAAFFYAMNAEEKLRFDLYVSLGYLKVVA